MRNFFRRFAAPAILFCGLLSAQQNAQRHKLVVISVDGLDNRYLRNADELGLKIPVLRQLMREGQVSRGVIGVVPTITWPSHTTIITGVDPVTHGILGNQKPKSEGGDFYWSASLIKTKTLLQAAREAGLTAASITWPVTVDAPVDWNLPEYFRRRRGGSMDLRSIESKSKPANLVEKIGTAYPSFAQEWMDDRTRALAAVYLLRNEHPDLLLIHFVDLDSEEHDNAPFTRESNAILERTDELIGQIRSAMEPNSDLAIVSDHGFERVNRVVSLKSLAPNVQAFGGIAIAPDRETADKIRALSKDPQYGVGREIPREELDRFPSTLPKNAAAVFESAEGFMFSPNGELFSKPQEAGNHGHWPMRYRAVFVLTGHGVPHEELPEMSMKQIAGRLAAVLGVAW